MCVICFISLLFNLFFNANSYLDIFCFDFHFGTHSISELFLFFTISLDSGSCEERVRMNDSLFSCFVRPQFCSVSFSAASSGSFGPPGDTLTSGWLASGLLLADFWLTSGWLSGWRAGWLARGGLAGWLVPG